MATREKPEPEGGGRVPGDRLVVVGPGGKRPFMRGIMVHSLMSRGVSFDEAYRTADQIRDHVRASGGMQIEIGELAKLATEFLGEDVLGEHQPPIPLPPPIVVTRQRGDESPFSKGILSQSLLAASIDPNDAFDVAREIEAELRSEGRSVVDRSELRERANAALRGRFGEKTAARYRAWRRHQDPQKPVIILLGGTTGAGKTSLALEVALRLGISRVMSTDSIREVMRIMLSSELMPALHASSFDAYRHLPASIRADDPVVDGFLSQATAVSVGVRAMIDRAVEENTSLVMDGVSLVPGLIGIDRYRDDAHIIFLIVARLDSDAFSRSFANRAESTRRPAERYEEHLEEILRVQDYILECADVHDVPIIDNVSVDRSVMFVIRHVVELLRKTDERESSTSP